MELIKNFGIDPILLIAQILNFLIILYILKRFLYKPVLELLKNREESIKEGLRQAEEARLTLNEALKKEKELLAKANIQAEKMLDDAKKERLLMMQKTEAATKKQAEKMLQEARENIAYETKEAEKRLMSHIGKLAVNFLQKSAVELFSNEEKEIVMKNVLRKMKQKTN